MPLPARQFADCFAEATRFAAPERFCFSRRAISPRPVPRHYGLPRFAEFAARGERARMRMLRAVLRPKP